MDSWVVLLELVGPGIAGGLVLAFVFWFLQRRHRFNTGPDPFRREPLSTDVINMSRIRVAGVGGLGLVAMALTVAWNVPRIGRTLAAGLVLGAVMAACLILRRRGRGPMPSSGRRAGAKTILSIDDPVPVEEQPDPSKPRLERVTLL